jgi:PelA/Pel-15E family pectate lyase
MKITILTLCLVLIFSFGGATVFSQPPQQKPIDLGGFYDIIRHARYENPVENDSVYKPEQVLEIAENILLYQNQDGGWAKNVDLLRVLSDEEKKTLHENLGKNGRSTLDNRNIYPQITYLSHLYVLTEKKIYRDAVLRGIEYILQEQRPSGGWRGWDVDAVTFNDDVMAGTLTLLKAITEHRKPYYWIPESVRKRAESAVARGVECILKCQIKREGQLTAWGQQHDHETFESVGARKYEFPCITAEESVGVVEFLMSIENPSDRIIEAIESAVRWLDHVRIEGIRIDTVPLNEPVRYQSHQITETKVVINDPQAPSIWARFYDIQTDEPFFARREGKRVHSLAEVDPERRVGYAWYGPWARHLIEHSYPAWKRVQKSKTCPQIQRISILEYTKTHPLQVYRVEKKQERGEIPLNESDQINNFHIGNNVLTLSGKHINDVSNIDQIEVLYEGKSVLLKDIPELHLFLNNNEIEDLPLEFGNLDNVIFLYLNSNRFRQVPRCLPQMEKLLGIYFSQNKITKLPSEIFTKTDLKKFEFANNFIETIPNEIGNLTQLIHLNFRGNCLTTVPETIEKLQRIRVCDFSDNRITVLPTSFGNLSPVYVLRLNNNPELRTIPFGSGLDSMSGVIEMSGTAIDTNSLPPSLKAKTNEIDSKDRRNIIDEILKSSKNH